MPTLFNALDNDRVVAGHVRYPKELITKSPGSGSCGLFAASPNL
jgi:hypothetical protein